MRTTTRAALLTGIVAAMGALVGLPPASSTQIAGAEDGPARRPPESSNQHPPPEDWPRWLGPRGDGISRATGLADTWPQDGPPRLWSQKVGIGFASPIARDGVIYQFSIVDEKDTLFAFDAASGRKLWAQSGQTAYLRSHGGTRATPTIDGEFIYTYGGEGELICRRLAGGELVWRVNLLEATGTRNIQWGLASSPTIIGERIYVQVGRGGPAAVAVNKSDGKIAWKSSPSADGSYATIIPAEVEGRTQLIVFGGRAVMGLDIQTGRTLWQQPWKTSYDVHAATPIYRDGRLFITSGYRVGCAMFKLTADRAELLWRKDEPHCKFPPPVLDGDHLYVNSENDLMCLSWPDGEVKWKCTERRLRLGHGGSFVRVGDRLIAISERGELSLVKATPQGYEIISQVQLFRGSNVWSTPLIYGGRLYVKGVDELVCLDISAGAGDQ